MSRWKRAYRKDAKGLPQSRKGRKGTRRRFFGLVSKRGVAEVAEGGGEKRLEVYRKGAKVAEGGGEKRLIDD